MPIRTVYRLRRGPRGGGRGLRLRLPLGRRGLLALALLRLVLRRVRRHRLDQEAQARSARRSRVGGGLGGGPPRAPVPFASDDVGVTATPGPRQPVSVQRHDRDDRHRDDDHARHERPAATRGSGGAVRGGRHRGKLARETPATDPAEPARRRALVARVHAMLFTASTIKDSPANVALLRRREPGLRGRPHVRLPGRPAGAGAEGGRGLAGRRTRTSRASRPGAGSWWADDRPSHPERAAADQRQLGRGPCSSPWRGPSGCSTSTATRSPASTARRSTRSPRASTRSGCAPGGGQPAGPARTRPTQFKRLLDDSDLNLLHVLGASTPPRTRRTSTATSWASPASGPASGLGLTLHEAVSPDGRPQDAPRRTRGCGCSTTTRVSGAEFIRKWRRWPAPGPRATGRPGLRPRGR